MQEIDTAKFGGMVAPFNPSKFDPDGTISRDALAEITKVGDQQDALQSFLFLSDFTPQVYDPSKKPSDRPGVEVSVDVPGIGAVEVQVMGPKGGPLAIAQHGSNKEWSAITEFDAVASELAGQGYRVLLPNLYSNPNTTPAIFGEGISDAEFQRVLEALMEFEGDGSGALPLLLGKSWGGGAAAKFAANNPSVVKKLVLVAPAPKGTTPEIVRALQMPLLVLWAKDDPIVPVSGATVFQEHSPGADSHLIVVDTGGHVVLPEYNDPILAFAGRA